MSIITHGVWMYIAHILALMFSTPWAIITLSSLCILIYGFREVPVNAEDHLPRSLAAVVWMLILVYSVITFSGIGPITILLAVVGFIDLLRR